MAALSLLMLLHQECHGVALQDLFKVLATDLRGEVTRVHVEQLRVVLDNAHPVDVPLIDQATVVAVGL